jgi:hypothetical protein
MKGEITPGIKRLSSASESSEIKRRTNYKAAGYLTSSLVHLGGCLKRYAESELQLAHRDIGVCVADDAAIRAVNATRT